MNTVKRTPEKLSSMKLTLITQIIKNRFFLLLLLNLSLLLAYIWFQPKCEACVDKSDCPPCLSDEQYFIFYFGIMVNLIFVIYHGAKWAQHRFGLTK